jgi:hypothetical protein
VIESDVEPPQWHAHASVYWQFVEAAGQGSGRQLTGRWLSVGARSVRPTRRWNNWQHLPRGAVPFGASPVLFSLNNSLILRCPLDANR